MLVSFPFPQDLAETIYGIEEELIRFEKNCAALGAMQEDVLRCNLAWVRFLLDKINARPTYFS